MELKINTSYLGCYSNKDNLSTTYSNIKYETEINPNFLKEKTIKDNYKEIKIHDSKKTDKISNKEYVPTDFDIEKATKYYFIRLYSKKMTEEEFRQSMSKLLKLYNNKNFNKKLYTKEFFENLDIPEEKKILVNNHIFNSILNHNRTDNYYSNNREIILSLINLNKTYRDNKLSITDEEYDFNSINNLSSIYYPTINNMEEENYKFYFNHTYFQNDKFPYLKFIKLATHYFNKIISKNEFKELLFKQNSDNIRFNTLYSNNSLINLSSKFLILSLLLTKYDKEELTFDELFDKTVDYLDNKIFENEIVNERLTSISPICNYTRILLTDSETEIERKKLMICTQWKLFTENQFSLKKFINRIKLIMTNQIIFNQYEELYIKEWCEHIKEQIKDRYYRDTTLNYNLYNKYYKTIRILIDNLYDGKYSFEEFIYLINSLIEDTLDIEKIFQLNLENQKNSYQSINNLLDNIKKVKDNFNKDRAKDYILPDNETNNILKEKAEKYNKILDLIKKNFDNYKTLIDNEDFYKDGEEKTK